MRLSPRSAILAFAALVAFACSGSTTSDLLTGTAASGSSSGESSGNASSSGDVSSSGNPSSSGNGSSSSSSGGSSGAVVDAGRPDVSVPDPDKNAVICNGKETPAMNNYCTGNQVCCGKRNGSGPAIVAMACTQPLACADVSNQIPFSCDDREDCQNGQVCCGYGYNNTTGQFIYTRSACALVCPDVILCDPDLGGGQCPNGRSCQPSAVIPGYFACLN